MEILFITCLIVLFGSASYIVGVGQMLRGKYRPSTFSRVVWLVLAALSCASVVSSGASSGAVWLAAVFLAGNAAMCIVSFWKGVRTIGRLEYICLAILALSGLAWLVFKSPVISLAMSLLAHFVGGVPTIRKAWKRPKSESTSFWWLFFVASTLSLALDWGKPLHLLIFPLYFVVFDGLLTALTLRKK